MSRVLLLGALLLAGCKNEGSAGGGALMAKAQAGADPDFVGAPGDIDGNHSHSLIPFSTRATVLPCGPLPLTTWTGACE